MGLFCYSSSLNILFEIPCFYPSPGKGDLKDPEMAKGTEYVNANFNNFSFWRPELLFLSRYRNKDFYRSLFIR